MFEKFESIYMNRRITPYTELIIRLNITVDLMESLYSFKAFFTRSIVRLESELADNAFLFVSCGLDLLHFDFA